MRNYRLTINGKTYHVAIDDPHARPVRVQVDGKSLEVYVDPDSRDNGASVAPVCASGGALEHSHAVAQTTAGAKPLGVGDEEDADIDAVTAPMPGTILSVSVEQGEKVRRGQEVCVLEAMKMKNSIKSPREGTIAEVATSVGAAVAYGDPLVRLQ
jgi:biotin carboxyl carrier protein